MQPLKTRRKAMSVKDWFVGFGLGRKWKAIQAIDKRLKELEALILTEEKDRPSSSEQSPPSRGKEWDIL
jgi:hypothetical protein